MKRSLPILARVRRVLATAISRHNIVVAKPALAADGGPRWVALPGQCLELGNTGWQIVMTEKTLHHPLGLTKPEKHMGYQAISPEGREIAWTQHNLQGLKTTVEAWARDRHEFFP